MMNRKVKLMTDDFGMVTKASDTTNVLIADFVKASYADMLISFEESVPKEEQEGINLPVSYLTSMIENLVHELVCQGYQISIGDVVGAAEVAIQALTQEAVAKGTH